MSVTNHSRYLSSHLDPSRPGQAYPVMPKRLLGGTGITVGEIGLGTAALGRLEGVRVPDDEARFTLGLALDMQACFLDTAPTYGDGRAERLLGEALKGRRAQAVVCTKAGYFSDGRQDFSPGAIRASLEASLRRMGLEAVDVLLLHNPPASVLTAADGVWAELAKFKQAGKLRAYGASLSGTEALKAALEKTPCEVLQFPYNAFTQENAAIFELGLKKRVGLVVNRPLDSGFLTGRYGAHHVFFDERKRFSRAALARRAELAGELSFMATAQVRLEQAALQFVLAHPAVSCAIPGASSWQQVIGNASSCQWKMPMETVAKVRSFWEKNLKGDPLPL